MVIIQSGLRVQALLGVGKTIAITLVLELGNFSRFPNPKHIMAYIGLTPPRYHRYAKRLQRSGRKGANGVER